MLIIVMSFQTIFDRTALIINPSSLSEQEPRNRSVLLPTAGIVNNGSGKSILRVQFFANISLPSMDTMVLTGSLPQLTAWGCGCPMKASSNSYQYDLDIEVERGSTDVIEFQYMYLLVRSPPNRPLDALRPLATGIPVWESKPSRCKLHLAKLLDHIPANPTSARDRNVKIVFQATGIETTTDTELLLVGTDTSLGELDLKKSCTMNKNPAGTYQYTIFVGPSTSFSFWFTLMRKSASLFHTSNSQEDPADGEPAILWTSGIGTVKQVKQSRPLAVIHLLDNWDVQVSPDLPVYERRRSAPAAAKVTKSDAESDSRLQCKVCWEEDSQAAFVPCGHAATCWKCSAKVRKCPVCRAPIIERIRIYL